MLVDMNDTLRNIVRTATPAIIGAATSWITKVSAHLTPSETAIIFPIATTAYYSIIRLLETKYPKFSWLLGALPVKATNATPPTTPVAVPATPATPAADAPAQTK